MYVIGWHWHHEAELPLEINFGTLEDRLRDIDSIKSISETPDQIARRKQLIKVFEGELPEWLQPADADRHKAYAELHKANAEWHKADADRHKADAEWHKAYADRQKADAELQKAYAEWNKAYADWQKANAELQKAYADWHKAYAEWQKSIKEHLPELMELHKVQCGCGWTLENRNIFNYKP